MRHVLMVVSLLLASLASVTSAAVQVSVGFSVPGLTIGINLPAYPYLVQVPGYPVYYAPQLDSNYFFYDGLYWVFVEDNWYVSYWYNGPWEMVYPDYVPWFILRVPVYYYRLPPWYFHGWWRGGPPHWGERWGRDWERRHAGWHQWDMSTTPPPAPLPHFQRDYVGHRYPAPEQQRELIRQYYRHTPQDDLVRQHFQRQQVPHVKAYQPQRQDRQDWQPSRDAPREPVRGAQPEKPRQEERREPRMRSHGWPSFQQDSEALQWQDRERRTIRVPVMIQQRTPDIRYQRQSPQTQKWNQERRVTPPEAARRERASPSSSREGRGGRQNEDRGEGRNQR